MPKSIYGNAQTHYSATISMLFFRKGTKFIIATKKIKLALSWFNYDIAQKTKA
ncbi:MAG: hypothetical protein JNM36_15000 [Chitinophagales bacterium]|jgi:hypothetical protein|nr:hypothetical protein [Chitinophagales bacterium]